MSKNNKNTAVSEELAVVEQETTALVEGDDFGSFSDYADKRTAAEVITEVYRIVQAMTKAKNDNELLRDGMLYGSMTKKGFDELFIAPIYDYKTIVERVGDNAPSGKKKGDFVKDYFETSPDSGDFGDARINAYVKKAGLKDLHKTVTDNGNQIGLVYNCYFAKLDKATGLPTQGFGLLQADKTNIRPYLLWRQDRVEFEGATCVPTFSFRTRVTGKGKYKNPAGNVTQQYTFEPFDGKNWQTSLIGKVVPAVTKDGKKTFRLTGTAEEGQILKNLVGQRELMQSGAIKVAEFSDADDSEDAQEAAAF